MLKGLFSWQVQRVYINSPGGGRKFKTLLQTVGLWDTVLFGVFVPKGIIPEMISVGPAWCKYLLFTDDYVFLDPAKAYFWIWTVSGSSPKPRAEAAGVCWHNHLKRGSNWVPNPKSFFPGKSSHQLKNHKANHMLFLENRFITSHEKSSTTKLESLGYKKVWKMAITYSVTLNLGTLWPGPLDQQGKGRALGDQS